MAEAERDYVRDRTLERHETARAKGQAVGGLKVTDVDMPARTLRLREERLGLRRAPPPATVMRMLR
ncbi:hypothetical protein ACFYWS_31025 [Streptomyces sp. NPDC002795]|uniref:hypothetical protein n=1 Tax=Streptomyces sp. NPDC002795 TaxID=3364665 RepID=UPI003695BC98